MFHPMNARLQGPALAKLSATCKTWRDAAAPAVWRALCVARWPMLARFSVQSCDWKQRYAMLAQCGAPPATPTFNIDEYEFFLSARAVGTVPLSAPSAEYRYDTDSGGHRQWSVASTQAEFIAKYGADAATAAWEHAARAPPPAGAVKEGPILFSQTATWQSKTTFVDGDMINSNGNANGAFLQATLPSPLALPEGLLTIEAEDESEDETVEGGSVVGMQPLHFTVHAHHKPLGAMAHMMSFQLPDSDYDFEVFSHVEEGLIFRQDSRVAGVGAGDWQARMQQVYPNGPSDYADHGFCRFETPHWLGNLDANFGSGSVSDQLCVRANLEFDDKHRLLSVEFVPCRYGDDDVNLGPAPWWEVPMSLDDLPAVCRSLQWA